MAKGYDKGRAPRGKIQGFYDNQETRLLQKLGEMVSDLYMATSEADVKRLWSSAHRALLQTKADKDRVQQVIAQKRVGALAKLVTDLTVPEKIVPAKKTNKPQTAASPDDPSPLTVPSVSLQNETDHSPETALPATLAEPDIHKSAMKAFRKRLKLTKLNDESKLGRSPMSSGKKSAVLAIMAPREYPQSVWDELVRQGKLRHTGSGFYELAE